MGDLRDLVLIAIAMLFLDITWLRIGGGVLFRRWLGGLMRPRVSYLWAGLTYAVMVFGLWWFVDLSQADWFFVALDGFVFGVVMFFVYEGTNMAILSKWPKRMIIVDTLWGGVLCAISSLVAYLV